MNLYKTKIDRIERLFVLLFIKLLSLNEALNFIDIY